MQMRPCTGSRFACVLSFARLYCLQRQCGGCFGNRPHTCLCVDSVRSFASIIWWMHDAECWKKLCFRCVLLVRCHCRSCRVCVTCVRWSTLVRSIAVQVETTGEPHTGTPRQQPRRPSSIRSIGETSPLLQDLVAVPDLSSLFSLVDWYVPTVAAQAARAQ